MTYVYNDVIILRKVHEIWARKPNITFGTAVRYARDEIRKEIKALEEAGKLCDTPECVHNIDQLIQEYYTRRWNHV